MVKESYDKNHDETDCNALLVDEVSGSENEQSDKKMTPIEHLTSC